MKKPALLIMDVQSKIVDRLKDKEAYLDKVRVAVAAAHKQDVLIIQVVVGFRDGVIRSLCRWWRRGSFPTAS